MGKDAVGGRDAPALYFGSTKMNRPFSVVDADGLCICVEWALPD